jgi:hypothetical protein
MYLLLLPLYVGGSLLFRLPGAWVLLVPLFLVLHFGVVIPEEKCLEASFGEGYTRYKRRVPRRYKSASEWTDEKIAFNTGVQTAPRQVPWSHFTARKDQGFLR